MPGDIIVSINGHEIRDSIDFRFYAAEERIELLVRKKNQETKLFSLLKHPDDMLGLAFSPLAVRRCKNRCIFCFVDQMPRNCRKELYVKDEDVRASFLYGNYITLNALSSSDWERVNEQRLSPLYISVHSTDPSVRSSMLGTTGSPDIMESMKRLASAGIRMHTQIVLCPGINDGLHLLKTLGDLSSLFPAVSSIAVVPVGLTAHRKNLFPLRTVTSREARELVAQLAPLQRMYKKQFGTRLVFPSDEFYIRGRVSIPPYSFYEDFPQRENGVGMTAYFLHEASRVRIPKKISSRPATIVTGMLFQARLRASLERLRSRGAVLHEVPVKNTFFGPSVTVAGLLTGQDIAKALKGKRLGDMVIIPAEALKEDEPLFLDDMSLEQLEHRLSVRVAPVADFRDVVTLLNGQRRAA